MYINDAILHFLILEHLCSNIGTWNMDQEATSYSQGGLDPTKGDFDWSEIDQSGSVGAETSYVPFFTPHRAWLTCAQLIRSINTSPG
jgi:hypothetical protein